MAETISRSQPLTRRDSAWSAGRTYGPVIVAFVLVAAFHWWTVTSRHVAWNFGREQTDYYNLLVDGFLAGQLNLKAEVPAALLACPDPYDPEQRPAGVGLHDASLYRGKYYIYYGVVPAVVLLLPFRLIFGVDLPMAPAVFLFVTAGHGVALLLLAGVRRRAFPGLGRGALGLLGVMAGLLSGGAILLRRASMYELPIAAGCFFALAALWLAWRVLATPSRGLGLTAGSSLCWGLAVGCRPTYLLAPLALFAVLWWIRKREPRGWGGVSPRAWLLAAAAPLLAVGLALAWYNYARFGHPMEFGVRYILSGVYESKIEHFRLRYTGWNLYAYFFAPLQWGPYFPFVADTPVTWARPRQHFGMDMPLGLLTNLPYFWGLGLVPLVFAVRRAGEGAAAARWLAGGLAWLALAVLAMILCFYAAMVRYLGDFAPALALLASLGFMAALTASATHGGWVRRWGVGGGVLVVSLVSALALFGFSAQAYGQLRSYNPWTYQGLARWLDIPAQFVARWRASPERTVVPPAATEKSPREKDRGGLAVADDMGGLRLKVRFPSPLPVGTREPLFVSGETGRGDHLMVEYVAADRVRVVFEHWGRAPYFGPEFAVTAGREYRFGLSHPAYSRAGFAGRVPAGGDDFTVEVDGRVIWRFRPLVYPLTAPALYVGRNPIGGPPGADVFSGMIRAGD